MNLRNATLSILFLASANLIAQDSVAVKTFEIQEPKLSYLDSLKTTFVHDNIASCVDSLWMKELTSLDIFNELAADVKNIDLDKKVDYELSTELLKERLKQMDAKSPFNIEYNPGLENIIKSFLKNRKKSYERLMAVSEFYFPIFEEAMARHNVPLEIKYLAIVESALNPKAVSRMGATGLWQFMYQTGKQYNLKIDSYVDERSDVLKASEAAAKYMANMYRIFGDWDLVLASYNSGPGNVAKAIRRSGGQQNYWNIRRNLPKETQGYVPAFLATMYIYEYHKEHGIVPNRALVKHFETDTVMVRQQLTFKQISDLLDMPVAQLQLLNPSFKLNTVPSYHDKPHFLRLPKDKIAIFTSNEDKIYAYANHENTKRERPFNSAIASRDSSSSRGNSDGKSVTKTKYHKVRKGDSLGEISQKYGVSIASLKKWNGLKNNYAPLGRNLKIVTRISVPDEAVAKTSVKSNADAAVAVKESNKTADSIASKTPQFYVVKSGDNLSAIAKKHNVSVDDIKKWNNLSDNTIQLDSKLKLQDLIADEEVSQKEREPLYKTQSYTVVKGDNLSTIAQKNGISLTDLKNWNNLSDNNLLVGSNLIVSKKEITNNALAEKPSKKDKAAGLDHHYFVKKGDSLFSIAKKYPGVTISDIKKWNGISGDNLKPGMKLRING